MKRKTEGSPREILNIKRLIFCIQVKFYAPVYVGIVLIYVKKNTKFSQYVMIQNIKLAIMEYNPVRLSDILYCFQIDQLFSF